MTNLPESKLTRSQLQRHEVHGNLDGKKVTAVIKLRYDDECGNGHNTFAITADIYAYGKRKTDCYYIGGGSCHEAIAKLAPQFEKYIKWHLCSSSDGPMHYLANTLYLAGTKDCLGKEKGEPYNFKKAVAFGQFPIVFDAFDQDFIDFLGSKYPTFEVEIISIEHKEERGSPYVYAPKWTFGGYADEWYKCPFDTETEAERFLLALKKYKTEVWFPLIPTNFGEGKEPDLKAARSCAIWPDATLEQLQNKELLEARLPALMEEFKKDMEELGFTY